MRPTYTYHPGFHELWPTADKLKTIKHIQICHTHPFIESCLAIESEKDQHFPFIILPDLSSHLICYQHTNGKFRIRVIGPRTKAIKVNRKGRKKTWILRLRPNALIGHSSPRDLTNKSADFFELMEQENNCNHQLTEKTDEELFKYLTNLFSPINLDYQRPLDSFIQYKAPSITVSCMAKNLGISERYLRKICWKNYGMPPKMLLKIQRLTKSFYLKEENKSLAWAQIALEAGYYDQSHMIDEYQQFLKSSPGGLFE